MVAKDYNRLPLSSTIGQQSRGDRASFKLADVASVMTLRWDKFDHFTVSPEPDGDFSCARLIAEECDNHQIELRREQ
jgi:hypothetical protein